MKILNVNYFCKLFRKYPFNFVFPLVLSKVNTFKIFYFVFGHKYIYTIYIFLTLKTNIIYFFLKRVVWLDESSWYMNILLLLLFLSLFFCKKLKKKKTTCVNSKYLLFTLFSSISIF